MYDIDAVKESSDGLYLSNYQEDTNNDDDTNVIINPINTGENASDKNIDLKIIHLFHMIIQDMQAHVLVFWFVI